MLWFSASLPFPFPPFFFPLLCAKRVEAIIFPPPPLLPRHTAQRRLQTCSRQKISQLLDGKNRTFLSSSNHHVQSKKKYNMRPSLSWKQRGSLLFFLPFQQLGRAVTRALLLLLLPHTNHETAKEEKGGTHTHLFFPHRSPRIFGEQRKGPFPTSLPLLSPPSSSSFPPISTVVPPTQYRIRLFLGISAKFLAIFLLTRVGESHSFFLGKKLYDIRPSRSPFMRGERVGGRSAGRRMSLPHKPKGKKRHKKDPENRGDSTTVDD